jgi:hypothetical protein
MEYERGFHGWLAFFFVTSCIAAIVQGYYLFLASRGVWLAISTGYGAMITASAVAQSMIITALLIGRLYGLWLFAHEDRRSPAFWSAFLLLVVPADLVIHMLGAYQASTIDGTAFVGELRGQLETTVLRSFAVSLAWALYWMRSRRVRETYGYNGLRMPPPAPTSFEPAA